MNILVVVDRDYDSINTEILIYLKTKLKVNVVDLDNPQIYSIIKSHKGINIWLPNQNIHNEEIWPHVTTNKNSWLVLADGRNPDRLEKIIGEKVNIILLPPTPCLYLNTKNHKILRVAIEILTWSVDKLKIKERSLESLSKKENEVVNLLLEGLDDQGIASRLYISDKTVRNHISNVLQKVGLKNRTQLVLWALQQLGYVEQLSK